MLHKAKWWIKEKSGRIKCMLCPRYCILAEGQKGFCFVRENIDGTLYSAGYGRPTGFAVDPIEKKPLNHFYPGSQILSFGTAGCNLGCKFCQNWTMSKAKLDEIRVVSKLYEYRLLRNPSVTLSEFQISTAYKNAQMQILRMGGDPYKSDGLNEIMEIFAHNMGMTYMRDAR